MNKEYFHIDKKYVISAIKNFDSRVYYSFDIHSGGMPTWCDSLRIAKMFDKLETVPESFDEYMKVGVTDIKILEIATMAKIISYEDIADTISAQAEREIEETREKFNAKIAAYNKLFA